MKCLGEEQEIAQNLMALAGPHARQVAILLVENCWRKADSAGLAFWNAVLELIAPPKPDGGEPSLPPRPAPHARRMLHPSYEMVAETLTIDGARHSRVTPSR